MDFAYNIRGWLTAINDVTDAEPDKLFNFRLIYNDSPTNPLYNGNISAVQWRTDNDDKGLKGYTYDYDALNRIKGAKFNTGQYNLGGYDVSGNLINPVAYDKNGNIISLERQGHTNLDATTFGDMDHLTYTYDNGNKLLSVTDAVDTPTLMNGEFKDGNKVGSDYSYDSNGNLIMDLNKGIPLNGIAYNHLNLPEQVTINNSEHNGNIQYIYDAMGTKLRKIATETGESSVTTTDYAGNYVYENTGSGFQLQFFSHPEGYVSIENGGYKYVYQYKDHLGNIRLSYNEDPSNPGTPTIIEENNYYPFGLRHKGYNNVLNGVANKYHTFQGVEHEESLGLNIYEMDVRNYDPAISRFTTIDPVTHFSYSTYSAFDNNPIYWSDPTGADSESFLRDLFDRSESGTTWTNTGSGTFSDGNGNTAQCDDCNESESSQEQQDPNPFGDIQVSEKQGWFGKLMGDANGRKWKGPDGVWYSVDEEGYPTGRYMPKVIGSSGSIEYISAGGLGVILKLPKYLKYLRHIKSSKDLLKYAVKASDAFKLTSGGGKFKAVLEGGAYGAGQHFVQLVKNGWNYQKAGNVIKLTKNGETIIFRASKSGKKGFDTFTLPNAYEGKNVDIFFK